MQPDRPNPASDEAATREYITIGGHELGCPVIGSEDEVECRCSAELDDDQEDDADDA